MAQEIAEAPGVCVRQFASNRTAMRDAGAMLRRLAPPFAATMARGSSFHAASFAKSLFELRCAVPTLSHSLSVGALYHATSPLFAGVPVFAVSQSGRSPDLNAAAAEAQERGATLFALVNDADSPLAERADVLLPLHAGPELSVAATKTFLASLVALCHLAAEWGGDGELLAALEELGTAFAAVRTDEWRAAVPLLKNADRLLVLGRGHTLPIAAEAALKLKEVAGIHAEAFSTAEVAHGPMTLVGEGDVVLLFSPQDEARKGLEARVADFVARGARVVASGPTADLECLALALPPSPGQPAVSALMDAYGFYHLAEALARDRGRDPDRPPFLRKVTRTL